MKKKAMLICGVLFAFVCAIVLYLVTSSSSSEFYRLIKVTETKGKMEVQRDDVGTLDAYKNMHLKHKDHISVFEESMAVLEVDEDKYLYVEPNTQFRIEAQGDEENSKTRIVLEKGSVISEIQKPLNENSVYEIETPNSTMSVRGTVFRVDVNIDENGESYTDVQVFDGKVASKLVYPDGSTSAQEVLIPAGAALQSKGDSDNSEYVVTMIDGKENVLVPIKYEELTLETLENLKTIITHEENDVVISLQEVETLLESKKEVPKEPISHEKEMLDKENSPILEERFKVDFYTGTQENRRVSIKAGELLHLSSPKKEGYDFVGWYHDKAYQHKALEPLVISSDMSLYAKWTPRKDTPYYIQHYVKKRGENTYTLVKNEMKKGESDTKFTYQVDFDKQPVSVAGIESCFYIKHIDEVLSGTISPQQPLEIKLYYEQGIQLNFYDKDKRQSKKMTLPYGTRIMKEDIPSLSVSQQKEFQSVGYFDENGNMLREDMIFYDDQNFYEQVEYRYQVAYYMMDSQTGKYDKRPLAMDSYYALSGTQLDINGSNSVLANKYQEKGYHIDLEYSKLQSVVEEHGNTTLKVYYKPNDVSVIFRYFDEGNIKEKKVVYRYGEKFENRALRIEQIHEQFPSDKYYFYGWKDFNNHLIDANYLVKENMVLDEDIGIWYTLVASVQSPSGDEYISYPDIYVKKIARRNETMKITSFDILQLQQKLNQILPAQHSQLVTPLGEQGLIQKPNDEIIVKFDRKSYDLTLVRQNGNKENYAYRYGSVIDLLDFSTPSTDDFVYLWYKNKDAVSEQEKMPQCFELQGNTTCYEIAREKIGFYVTYLYLKEDGTFDSKETIGFPYIAYDTEMVEAPAKPKDGYELNEEMSKRYSTILSSQAVMHQTYIKNEQDFEKYQNVTNVLWLVYSKKK